MVADTSFVYDEFGGAILSGFEVNSDLATSGDNLNGLATLAQPFESVIWIWLLCGLVAFAMMYSLTNHVYLIIQVIYRNGEEIQSLFDNNTERLFWTFAKCFGRLSMSLLKAPINDRNSNKKTSKSQQQNVQTTQEILTWFWSFVVLTIPAFYSSYIFAKIVARPVFVVESFDDVASLPGIELALWKGTGYGCKSFCPLIAKDFPVLESKMSSKAVKIKDLSKNELNSKESLDDVLDGKRVVFEQTPIILQTLSNRFESKDRCGFYVSSTQYTHPVTMLFNKNLNSGIRNVVNKK